MRWTQWIEENCKEDLVMYMDKIIHSYDENLTCYDNFKDLLSEIYSTAFEKWFLYWCKK